MMSVKMDSVYRYYDVSVDTILLAAGNNERSYDDLIINFIYSKKEYPNEQPLRTLFDVYGKHPILLRYSFGRTYYHDNVPAERLAFLFDSEIIQDWQKFINDPITIAGFARIGRKDYIERFYNGETCGMKIFAEIIQALLPYPNGLDHFIKLKHGSFKISYLLSAYRSTVLLKVRKLWRLEVFERAVNVLVDRYSDLNMTKKEIQTFFYHMR